MSQEELKIRNIAIIAHVDHGKTTLVDHLLRQSGLFRNNEAVDDRMMDSMDLERERGITIAAKNASFMYNDYRINIVDTPGHADFGGEVERALTMVDGAILLVDASEGPLPQTRFVLKNALSRGLKVIVCINKIDRPDARINEVMNEIFDLFIDLDATEEQADFDTVYAVAREGYATLDPNVKTQDLSILFNWIIEKFPAPQFDPAEPLQMMVANLDYNDYVGRLGIGRVRSGSIKVGDEVLVCYEQDRTKKTKISALFRYEGLKQIPAKEIPAGDIAILAGFEEINIGDSITSPLNPKPLPRLRVEEPTVAITMSVNDGPFAGLEGKQVTSRKILERLEKELRHNVAIRMEPTDSPETFKVFGRGELQLGVLVEQMRREGFEMVIGKPQVVFKMENGQKLEPIENVVVDVAEDYTGVVTEKLGRRKGVMTNMSNKGTGRVRLEFSIPARGLIGYRSEFLTDTRGTGLLNTHFGGYEPFRGELIHRHNGAMIADRKGTATAYALWYLEERGRHFILPGTETYEGMIIGEHAKDNDLIVNVAREKKLTNVRASGSDEAIKLTPIKPLTLEQAMEWINDDECIEVTPKSIRLRCRQLDPHKRKRAAAASAE
ncbi:MAG: translational GTPase TypA [Bdellovibrionaceae bacterium]|nr:translational GTPase TypA [Pseudobdellovibrionaceae bacterium]